MPGCGSRSIRNWSGWSASARRTGHGWKSACRDSRSRRRPPARSGRSRRRSGRWGRRSSRSGRSRARPAGPASGRTHRPGCRPGWTASLPRRPRSASAPGWSAGPAARRGCRPDGQEVLHHVEFGQPALGEIDLVRVADPDAPLAHLELDRRCRPRHPRNLPARRWLRPDPRGRSRMSLRRRKDSAGNAARLDCCSPRHDNEAHEDQSDL